MFGILGCPDDRKLNIAVFLLEGNAYCLWDSLRLSFPVQAAISWADFKQAFFEHFYPNSYRDAKLAEFLRLVQGTMIVAEYEQKFINLSKYALR